MDKIILRDKKEIEISGSVGLDAITVVNKTVEELETILIKDNLSKVEFVFPNGDVYGKYENLELVSITKYMEDDSIVIKLKQIKTTE